MSDFDDPVQQIAQALTRLADLAEKFYAAAYPAKPHARDATLSVVRSEEAKDLEETLHGSEKTLAQWRDIGPREQQYLDDEKAKSTKT